MDAWSSFFCDIVHCVCHVRSRERKRGSLSPSLVHRRQQVPFPHISLYDDCGVPRNRDESSGVANLIILYSVAL